MATMRPWSRVRVAKCQMLVTSFFVLVTGWSGGRGVCGGWGPCQQTSSTVVPTHTQPCCPHPAPGTCTWGPWWWTPGKWLFAQDALWAPPGSVGPGWLVNWCQRGAGGGGR